MDAIRSILIKNRTTFKKTVADRSETLNEFILKQFDMNKASGGITISMFDLASIYEGAEREIIANNIDVVVANILDDLGYVARIKMRDNRYSIALQF
nr:MAG TPA: hypothetical protein [Bacteriophage sp.]